MLLPLFFALAWQQTTYKAAITCSLASGTNLCSATVDISSNTDIPVASLTNGSSCPAFIASNPLNVTNFAFANIDNCVVVKTATVTSLFISFDRSGTFYGYFVNVSGTSFTYKSTTITFTSSYVPLYEGPPYDCYQSFAVLETYYKLGSFGCAPTITRIQDNGKQNTTLFAVSCFGVQSLNSSLTKVKPVLNPPVRPSFNCPPLSFSGCPISTTVAFTYIDLSALKVTSPKFGYSATISVSSTVINTELPASLSLDSPMVDLGPYPFLATFTDLCGIITTDAAFFTYNVVSPSPLYTSADILCDASTPDTPCKAFVTFPNISQAILPSILPKICTVISSDSTPKNTFDFAFANSTYTACVFDEKNNTFVLTLINPTAFTFAKGQNNFSIDPSSFSSTSLVRVTSATFSLVNTQTKISFSFDGQAIPATNDVCGGTTTDTTITDAQFSYMPMYGCATPITITPSPMAPAKPTSYTLSTTSCYDVFLTGTYTVVYSDALLEYSANVLSGKPVPDAQRVGVPVCNTCDNNFTLLASYVNAATILPTDVALFTSGGAELPPTSYKVIVFPTVASSTPGAVSLNISIQGNFSVPDNIINVSLQYAYQCNTDKQFMVSSLFAVYYVHSSLTNFTILANPITLAPPLAYLYTATHTLPSLLAYNCKADTTLWKGASTGGIYTDNGCRSLRLVVPNASAGYTFGSSVCTYTEATAQLSISFGTNYNVRTNNSASGIDYTIYASYSKIAYTFNAEWFTCTVPVKPPGGSTVDVLVFEQNNTDIVFIDSTDVIFGPDGGKAQYCNPLEPVPAPTFLHTDACFIVPDGDPIRTDNVIVQKYRTCLGKILSFTITEYIVSLTNSSVAVLPGSALTFYCKGNCTPDIPSTLALKLTAQYVKAPATLTLYSKASPATRIPFTSAFVSNDLAKNETVYNYTLSQVYVSLDSGVYEVEASYGDYCGKVMLVKFDFEVVITKEIDTYIFNPSPYYFESVYVLYTNPTTINVAATTIPANCVVVNKLQTINESYSTYNFTISKAAGCTGYSGATALDFTAPGYIPNVTSYFFNGAPALTNCQLYDSDTNLPTTSLVIGAVYYINCQLDGVPIATTSSVYINMYATVRNKVGSSTFGAGYVPIMQTSTWAVDILVTLYYGNEMVLRNTILGNTSVADKTHTTYLVVPFKAPQTSQYPFLTYFQRLMLMNIINSNLEVDLTGSGVTTLEAYAAAISGVIFLPYYNCVMNCYSATFPYSIAAIKLFGINVSAFGLQKVDIPVRVSKRVRMPAQSIPYEMAKDYLFTLTNTCASTSVITDTNRFETMLAFMLAMQANKPLVLEGQINIATQVFALSVISFSLSNMLGCSFSNKVPAKMSIKAAFDVHDPRDTVPPVPVAIVLQGFTLIPFQDTTYTTQQSAFITEVNATAGVTYAINVRIDNLTLPLSFNFSGFALVSMKPKDVYYVSPVYGFVKAGRLITMNFTLPGSLKFPTDYLCGAVRADNMSVFLVSPPELNDTLCTTTYASPAQISCSCSSGVFIGLFKRGTTPSSNIVPRDDSALAGWKIALIVVFVVIVPLIILTLALLFVYKPWATLGTRISSRSLTAPVRQPLIHSARSQTIITPPHPHEALTTHMSYPQHTSISRLNSKKYFS